MLPNIEGRETFGGGEIRFARGTGVDVSSDDKVSMDGYRLSKLKSCDWSVDVEDDMDVEGVCRALVDAGDAVCGISRLPAFLLSTSVVSKESPNPE
jgi:hypothetical protein